MREKDFLSAYFYNQEVWIEQELQELRDRIRFRQIRQEDCIELMLLTQRRADFIEFRQNVQHLLHLGKE